MSINHYEDFVAELSVMMRRQHALSALHSLIAIKTLNPSAKIADIAKIVDVPLYTLQTTAKKHYGVKLSELVRGRNHIAIEMLTPKAGTPEKFFKADGKLADTLEWVIMTQNGALVQKPMWGYIDNNNNLVIAISGRSNSKGNAKIQMRNVFDITKMEGYNQISISDIPYDRLEILVRN